MKRIILTIISVLFSITLSYAESCSCGQGCLSYQISGCGEQSRACCTGQWCSWGTSSCASCTATSQACSGNVTNACAGNRTRSVTGSCGSTCSYSGWNDSGCSYTQSCTATSESRNCSGNVTNACAGTQTRTRSVSGTCGSCSYGSWGSWSTNNCSYTQSCTATSESRNCSGNVSGACAGTQSRSRSVTGTCGSCSYGSWGSWTGNCTYTQSCTATTQACSGNVTNACAGNRTRTVTGTCGSCSYSGWSDSGCSYTQSCTATSDSTACSNVNSNYCAGTATRNRSVTGSCGSCSYGSWGGWSTGSCTSYVTCNREYTSSTQAYGSCGGSLVYNYYRDATNTCGGCTWGGWNHYSSSDDRWGPYCSEGRAYTSSTQAYGACGGSLVYYYYRDPSASCSGCSWPGWTQYSSSDDRWGPYCNSSREYKSETQSYGDCGGSLVYNYYRDPSASCSGCTWSSWTHYSSSDTRSWKYCSTTSSSYTDSKTETRNCAGNVSGACAGTQSRSCTRTCTDYYNSSCSGCQYSSTSCGSWSCGSWSGSCTYTQSCTDTSKTETETRNCSGNVSGACAGTQSRSRTCTRSVSNSCGSCSYGSWSCGSWSAWSGSCSYTQSCTDTSQWQYPGTTRNCVGNVSGACGGTQTMAVQLTRSVTGTCGSCSYSSWNSSFIWSTGGCKYSKSCTDTSTACTNVSSSYKSGTATRTVTNSCGSCSYSSWNTSSCVSSSPSCTPSENGKVIATYNVSSLSACAKQCRGINSVIPKCGTNNCYNRLTTSDTCTSGYNPCSVGYVAVNYTGVSCICSGNYKGNC